MSQRSASVLSTTVLLVLLGGCTSDAAKRGGEASPRISPRTEAVNELKDVHDSLPGEPITSPIEGIVVPKGVVVEEESSGYIRYRVTTSRPHPWVAWFSTRYPPSKAYRDWRYCGGTDAEDGSGMSRSWNKGKMGLLLNLNFVPPERQLLIMIGTSEFNDCEHVE